MAKKESGKNKKYGRNSSWCKIYKSSHQREKNKAVKLKRHLRKQPNDGQAAKALKKI